MLFQFFLKSLFETTLNYSNTTNYNNNSVNIKICCFKGVTARSFLHQWYLLNKPATQKRWTCNNVPSVADGCQLVSRQSLRLAALVLVKACTTIDKENFKPLCYYGEQTHSQYLTILFRHNRTLVQYNININYRSYVIIVSKSII